MNLQSNSNNIILIGFMCSGKSTVSKLLHKNTGKLTLDSDLIISNNHEMTIEDIFSKHGEEYFRKLEYQFCESIKNSVRDSIISTGGGIPTIYDVRQMGLVFYLDIPFEIVLERTKDRSNRPLLSNIDNALNIYNARKQIYKNLSDFKIDATRNANDIVMDIVSKI